MDPEPRGDCGSIIHFDGTLNSLFVTLLYWARVRDRGSVRVRVRVRVLESSSLNSILGSPVIGSHD